MQLMLEIFWSFVKTGSIAYGGGPSMIPILQAEVVEGKSWVTDDDFRAALGVGYALPGPIVTKMSFWVGWRIAGFFGGTVALIAVTLPSLLMMMLLTGVLWGSMGRNLSYLNGATKGASIGVVGLLLYVAYDQAHKVFVKGVAPNWLEGLRAHPDWVILVLVVFALAIWRPSIMVPLSVVGAAIYGAIFLR